MTQETSHTDSLPPGFRLAAAAAWDALHPTGADGIPSILPLDYTGFSLQGGKLTLRFLDARGQSARVVLDTAGSETRVVAVRGAELRRVSDSLPGTFPGASNEAAGGAVVGASQLVATSGETVVSFDFFWLGAAPTVDSLVCVVDVRDESGTVVAHRDIPIAGPLVEEARDGVVETTFPELAARASDVSASCRPWQGSGFAVVNPTVVQRDAPFSGMPAPYGDETAYVVGTATWSGEPSAQVWKCVGLAYRATGESVMPETLLYAGLPPSEGQAVEVPLIGVARIAGPIEDVSVDVTCSATNELDPELPGF